MSRHSPKNFEDHALKVFNTDFDPLSYLPHNILNASLMVTVYNSSLQHKILALNLKRFLLKFMGVLYQKVFNRN